MTVLFTREEFDLKSFFARVNIFFEVLAGVGTRTIHNIFDGASND